MRALAERGVHVWAIDLRGYGDTPRDGTGWITPNGAADDLGAVLRWVAERGGRRPHVLGWSMGSFVTHLAVQREPTLAERVILYGYPAAVRFPAADAPEPPLERRVTNEAAAREDFITPGVIDESEIAAFVTSALRADPVRADWRARSQLAALDPGALSRPTLFVHGDGDPLVPTDAAKAFVAALPDGTHVVIERADHAAHLEHPDRFVEVVLDFVRSEAPASDR
jgi:pimeloyl-ACP methyl ester carboxylesterase